MHTKLFEGHRGPGLGEPCRVDPAGGVSAHPGSAPRSDCRVPRVLVLLLRAKRALATPGPRHPAHQGLGMWEIDTVSVVGYS